MKFRRIDERTLSRQGIRNPLPRLRPLINFLSLLRSQLPNVQTVDVISIAVGQHFTSVVAFYVIGFRVTKTLLYLRQDSSSNSARPVSIQFSLYFSPTCKESKLLNISTTRDSILPEKTAKSIPKQRIFQKTAEKE